MGRSIDVSAPACSPPTSPPTRAGDAGSRSGPTRPGSTSATAMTGAAGPASNADDATSARPTDAAPHSPAPRGSSRADAAPGPHARRRSRACGCSGRPRHASTPAAGDRTAKYVALPGIAYSREHEPSAFPQVSPPLFGPQKSADVGARSRTARLVDVELSGLNSLPTWTLRRLRAPTSFLSPHSKTRGFGRSGHGSGSLSRIHWCKSVDHADSAGHLLPHWPCSTFIGAGQAARRRRARSARQ